MSQSDNLRIAKEYIARLSNSGGPEELDSFFAPDVVHEEFPNHLVPNGAKRDLAGSHYDLRKRWNTASYIVPFCWSAEIGVRKISISPSFSCSMRWVRWSSRGLNGP